MRIVIGVDAPDDVLKRALRYWSLTKDGSWSNRVADLGPASWVAETVSGHAQAQVLTLGCLGCGEAPTARTRSELDAIRSTYDGSKLCQECASRPQPAIPPPARSPEQEDAQHHESNEAEETPGEQPTPRLELDLLEDAPEELSAIAKQYWNLTHIELEGQYAVWAGPVKAIDTAGWGPAHIAAGAAVRARMPGRSCPVCSGQLTLTSRTAFEQACFGSPPACVDCSPALLEKMTKLRDPSRTTDTPVRKQGTSHARRHNAEARWAEQQTEEIRAHYEVTFLQQDSLPTGKVRTEATTLALLHYAPSTTPIGPLRLWAEPLDPDPYRTVGDLVAHGFLRIHPDSAPASFCWQPEDFREAITAAGGDIDAVQPPQLTNRYYAREAVHYVPHGTSMGTAVENLTAHLTARLTPAALDQERKEELLVLVQELIAAEAVRYFDLQLAKRHLPPVPDNHLARLRDIAQRGSTTLALGELNNLVWRAARSAADAAQRNPQAPRANMSTFAVNCLETYVQQALTETQPIKPYTFDASLLAALTRTVFYTILNADPFTTGVIQADQDLPEPAPPATKLLKDDDRLQRDTDPGVDTAGQPEEDNEMARTVVSWLAEHRSEWTPQDFANHLLYLQSQALAPRPTREHHAQAATASHMKHLYHDLTSLLGGNNQSAVLAVCSAAQHLLGDREHGAVGAGIVEQFVLRILPEQTPDISPHDKS
ncbi:hypothetical protein [Streptomyces sp. NPDC059743]|uniref:hypothetical protein n=1 Tax=Streptomyces sp. NPDC059743 TaxID=3346928 RepID=UPI00366808E4